MFRRPPRSASHLAALFTRVDNPNLRDSLANNFRLEQVRPRTNRSTRRPAMSNFEEYANKYKHVKMERRDGILQFTLHTNGGSVIWDFQAHSDTAHALGDVARDRDNKVIILTGAGDNFIAEHEFGDADKIPAAMWDHVITDAKYLIMNHLDVEAPMIAAVNGPALIHAELALLCDIVLAS